MSDRYEILGKVARGGIGAIYRANDTVMGREVAIKRLLPIEETHLNEAADESLEREAAALARFQHPNVVTIYAFESDDEGSYVVMELVEGENLKETIERGALPIDDFENLVLQTLDPLIAARDMNLLHRDIKPSNIMLTWLSKNRFQVKVLDFGLAKFSQAPSTQTLDQTGSFLGSIDYLAPEQLELAKLDQRTDLYSLGCVLYFCLTQRPPFAGKNSGVTIQNHLKHKVTPLRELRADVPKPIADWVMRMISRYPNQRPADSRAALQEFEAAIDGVTPAANHEPVVEIVEEVPLEEIAGESKQPKTAAGTPHFKLPPPASKPKPESKPATRPKLNVASAPVPAVGAATQGSTTAKRGTPSASKPKDSTRPGKPTRPPSEEKSRKPVAAILISVIGLALLAILLVNFVGDEGDGSGEPSSPPNSGGPGKGGEAAAPNGPPPKPLPEVSNRAEAAKTSPPPVTEGLVAHYKAGERCWGGKAFKTPVRKGGRVKAWGNLAPGAAATNHLLTVDVAHQEKAPALQIADPKKRPELNGPHPILVFRPSDRFITPPEAGIRSALSGPEWTVMLVMRTESRGGQIVRILGEPLPSRLLKLEITGNGNKYKTYMTRGSLRPSQESELKEGKGKFLIFTFTWTGEGYGEQNHHYLLPGNKRRSAKPKSAPHKKIQEPPKRYALGATDSATGLDLPEADDGSPQTEGTGGFKGAIAEWLIYRRALPDDERKQVEDYLYQRYFAKPGKPQAKGKSK